jgi:hypothetical protein
VEGKTHIQAMLSLARRRLNVLWAMLRDGTTYNTGPGSDSPDGCLNRGAHYAGGPPSCVAVPAHTGFDAA